MNPPTPLAGRIGLVAGATRGAGRAIAMELNLPAGRAEAAALAELLDRWVQEHPDPYLGAHWPT